MSEVPRNGCAGQQPRPLENRPRKPVTVDGARRPPRCQANMPQPRQSRPDSSLDLSHFQGERIQQDQDTVRACYADKMLEQRWVATRRGEIHGYLARKRDSLP